MLRNEKLLLCAIPNRAIRGNRMNQDAGQTRITNAAKAHPQFTETRVGTRAILRQLQSKGSARQLLSRSKLNEREVGLFLAEHARIMFLAASAANLPSLEKKAEILFYEASFLAEGLARDTSSQGFENSGARANG